MRIIVKPMARAITKLVIGYDYPYSFKIYPYSFKIADSGNSANMMVVRALVVYSTRILPSLT